MRFRLPFKKRASAASSRKPRSWFRFFGEMLGGFLFSTLVVVAIGLGMLVWGWSQRDHYLSVEIRKALDKKFPEAAVTFASAEFDQRGRVILKDLQFASRKESEPILRVPGVRVTVDQDLLINEQIVDIQSIELNRPELSVIRGRDGRWNWQQLTLPEGGSNALPLIRIRNARLALQWEHEDFSRAVRVQVDAIDLDLTPASRDEFQFVGVGREEHLGTTEFSGAFNLKEKTWDFSGEISQLRIDQPLLEVAANLSPDARTVIAQLRENHPEVGSRSGQQVAQIQPASATKTAGSGPQNPVTLELTTDIQFHSHRGRESLPDFSVFARLVDGRLRHPDLPVPLDQIEGSLAFDRLGIRLDDILIGSGNSTAQLSGQWGWQASSLPAHVEEGVDVNLRNFRVISSTRDYLPRTMQRVFDEMNPRGLISSRFRIRRGQDKPVEIDLEKAVVHEGTATHGMFSIPIHDVSGTVTSIENEQGTETWELDFEGTASKRPVEISGTVINPGPDAESVFDVNVKRFPVNEQFYQALRPKQQEVLRHLNIQGMADIHCVVLRRHAYGREPIVRLAVDVYDSSMRLESFPLPIQDLSGHVKFDEDGWQVTNVKGVHGETPLRAFGVVTPVENEEWKLDLTLSAEQARFNHELYLAISKADSKTAKVWDLLRPRGVFDMNMKVEWTTGQDVEVDIPLMKLRNCEINPLVMPWRLTDLTSTVTVQRNHTVAFEELRARHGECVIETSGSFAPLENYWQLRFDELDVDDLTPDQEFLSAAPEHVSELVRTLKLTSPISLSGPAEFKGDYAGNRMTSAWDTRIVLNQSDLFLGVDVQNVSGTITCQGKVNRDGIATIPHGKVAIDSCWVMGYHVTDVKGPFQVREDKIIAGSPKMFESEEEGEEDWSTVSREERVTGKIFGGELFLDLLVQRTPAMPYLLRTTLSRASLEQWAIESNYGQANIRGEVNGYIDLAGDTVSTRQTVGNGRLLISPAALYEVPVLFQMFQSLRFAPADDTAFRHAYAEFRVLDEKFVFDEIGLLGDTMSLFGEGYIRFDRTVDLDFVYRPPRRAGINFASRLISSLEGVLPVLFTVDVSGTIDVPRIEVKNGMRETLKGFRRLLEQTPGNIRPPKILPPGRIRIPTPDLENALAP